MEGVRLLFFHPHIIRTCSFSRKNAENPQHLPLAVMTVIAQVCMEANSMEKF
jgi:hypothetical protein